MKIIFSPSKEMIDRKTVSVEKADNDFIFSNKTYKILEKLKSFSKNEIANTMKIKNSTLENTFENINNFEKLEKNPAISMYNGVAFKELNLKEYDKKSLEYLEKTLYILSAFYGVSKAFTLVKKYRLDMTMPIKINGSSLYNFWKTEVTDFIKDEMEKAGDDFLINLASGEFSKMIDKKKIKMINIDFKELKDGKYVSISTYSKKARGQFLNILIKKRIDKISDLKKIEFDSYVLNLELSDESNFIFTKR